MMRNVRKAIEDRFEALSIVSKSGSGSPS
ncbi:MAG: hypothetical protein R3A11_00920 [Bdellovibrionota bacterium]